MTAQRYYGEDGTLAPHVVGYVADLTEEQYEQAKEEDNLYDPEDNPSGYKYGGEVAGRSGIEAAFEEELRGDRGQETIYTDENGEVTDTAVTLQPQEGSNVQLTLDADLQRVADLGPDALLAALPEAAAPLPRYVAGGVDLGPVYTVEF